MARGELILRQWNLLKMLQTRGEGISLRDPAREFQASERTIQRDFEAGHAPRSSTDIVAESLPRVRLCLHCRNRGAKTRRASRRDRGFQYGSGFSLSNRESLLIGSKLLVRSCSSVDGNTKRCSPVLLSSRSCR